MAKRATSKKLPAPPVATELLTEKPPPKTIKKLAHAAVASRELYHRPEMTGWTPQKIENAQSSADNGSLQHLADLCETMFADGRIKGVLGKRTNGMLGLPMDFVRGDEDAQKVLGTQMDGAPGEWLSMHDESETAKLLRWGLFTGVGLAQRIEQPRLLGRPHRYKLVTWSPRWLTYFQQPMQGCHWWVQTQEGMSPVVPGDGQWVLFLPYGARRPWSEGLWRALVFPWILKRFALEDRANYSEVLGSPLWVATTGTGSTEKQRNAFLSKLRTLGKNGKIVLPNGWELALKEATGKSWEIYENQIKWADQEMTIAIAGQLVTTEGTTGFSEGSIFENIDHDTIRFDADRLSTCLRSQSLEPWAMLNYGAASKAPWPQWQTKKPTDQKDVADGLSKIGAAVMAINAALAQYGLKVDAQKFFNEFEIPVLPAGDTNGQT